MSELGVGIIGAGGIAPLHAQAYLTIPSTRIAGMADVVRERVHALAQRFEVEAIYTDYKRMLKQSEVQVVSICTPPWTHKQIALDAIASGKHVLCEKPLALSLIEANEMVEAAEKSGLALAIDFQNRYLRQHQKAKQLLAEGLIGKLFQVRCRVGLPILDLVPSAAPMREWLFDREKSGGGVLTDFGSHWIDLTRWLVGDDIKTVSALCSSEEIRTVEDNAMILCRFGNGVQASIEASWTQKGGYNLVELYGRNGTIVCNGPEPVMVYTDGEGPSRSVGKGWTHPQLDSEEEPHKCLIQDFIKCVTSGTPPPVSGSDGMRVQEVVAAAYESCRTGGMIRLPLAPDGQPKPA